MTDVRVETPAYEVEAQVLVVGAGAAGLVAALAAREAGAEVVVLERDPLPRGSTALSAGLIPAAGTRWQAAAGAEDTPELFARDILAKAENEPDPAAVARLANLSAPVLEWLADAHGLDFSLVDDFRYPGHSAYRMHGLPSRSGEALVDRLREAAEAADVSILTGAHATTLYATPDRRVTGVEIARPDGARERIGCGALVLACNGYGGNKDLVAKHIPQMRDALYFGHPGNQGDAVLWGEALGAATRHLGGHQGHGSVAHPHGILITWACIMEGGFQVNREGRRFADESHGYSEAAAGVIAQPGSVAWTIFDARIAGVARQFEDFRRAEAQGAVVEAPDVATLADRLGLPSDALAATLDEVERLKARGATDDLGRSFTGVAPLAPPYRAVRVTGALFHTQGGLVVDADARVLDTAGAALPNLFAAGGAACGISGAKASGYLSGNGLLTAVGWGYAAGAAAASLHREGVPGAGSR